MLSSKFNRFSSVQHKKEKLPFDFIRLDKIFTGITWEERGSIYRYLDERKFVSLVEIQRKVQKL